MSTLLLAFLLIIPAPSKKTVETSTDLLRRFDRWVDGSRALEHARYFTHFWRVGGGPGFDSCVAYIAGKLRASGLAAGQRTGGSVGSITIQEDPPEAPVWVPEDASLTMTKPEQRVLHTFAQTPVMLCHNSFSNDVTAELVYVRGGGSEADYNQVDVSRKIVLCDVSAAAAFRPALQRGALGVISSYVPPYNAPNRFPSIIAEGSIPYDPRARSFGINISPQTAAALKEYLRRSSVHLRVQVKSSFATNPVKTLIAEIPGTTKPEERIILIAHLDHYQPGANDNASGSATLLELAVAMSSAMRNRLLAPPHRTITFLWVDEYRGSEFWIKRHDAELEKTKAVFVLDMVGGNPAITGGTFRVEKMPDPAVIWTRPPDQHSGWGVGRWEPEQLKGHFLNDFYLSIIRERSRMTGWKTTANVWEGGSDHDPFLRRGIPAILSWHFPDVAYHSSMDSISALSPTEMQNAGTSIAAAAYSLAQGTEDLALEILRTVSAAASARFENLNSQVIAELADAQARGGSSLALIRQQERAIVDAWARWYEEALRSVLTVPVFSPSSSLQAEVDAQINALREQVRTIITAHGL
jgi:aminopeptidase YwaD